MKKGFTLVELLAVIVILAIIAIITIPMISNVIEKSKLGAMEDSAYGLIDAANYYYAEHMNEMSSNKIFVIENGVGTSEEKLNYKGKIEGNAKVLLASNGKVALCLTSGKSYAKKGLTDSKVVMHTVSEAITCDITTSENGDVVIDITGGSTSDTINIKLEDMQRQIDEINGNLSKYNSETDSFDIYQNGNLIGSIPCGFNGFSVLDTYNRDWSLTSDSDSSVTNLITTISESSAKFVVNWSIGAWNNHIAYLRYTPKAINLTNFSNIKFIASYSSGGYNLSFGVSLVDKKTGVRTVVYSKSTGSSSMSASSDTSIDISGYSGEYYVELFTNSSPTITITVTAMYLQ